MRDYIAELLREQEEEEEERRKRGERIDGAPPLSRLRRQLPREGGAKCIERCVWDMQIQR